MDREYKAYRFWYFLSKSILGVFYHPRVMGRENIPSGAAVVCANHSSWVDPFLLAYAITSKYHTCLMAKAELFKSKIIGSILKAIGTFPVNREIADLTAMRTALKCLKAGKKLGIFPEGTRSADDGAIAPKGGAMRLAEKADALVLPMYIPRKKGFFRRQMIVIGKPFYIEKSAQKRNGADYDNIADGVMATIAKLGARAK